MASEIAADPFNKRSLRRGLSDYISPPSSVTQKVPVYQGIGTHYADVWVGSPTPQRQSVIVDTGSHYTAFPCLGCDDCGESYHTDLLFDYTKSNTFHKLGCDECLSGSKCTDDTCRFSQAYTEGSSWYAYQSVDKFWLGMNKDDAMNEIMGDEFAFDFMFGCQYRETGLFITQLATGIMGMSASDATIVKQMYDKGILAHNSFTMCFQKHLNYDKVDGVLSGAMVLGGYSSNAHNQPMLFVANQKSSGWFTVKLTNIYVRPGGGNDVESPQNAQAVRVKVDSAQLNTGKGVIVDSGTTDTYLSRSASVEFKRIWKDVTGRTYSNSAMSLTDEQVKHLPTVLIQLDGTRNGEAVNDRNTPGVMGSSAAALGGDRPDDIILTFPPTHYMEKSTSTGKYTPRLYFSESSGGVLGANFMQGHDILFDWENNRVGFAPCDCNYDDIAGEVFDQDIDCKLGELYIIEQCSAVKDCDASNLSNSLLSGSENWGRVIETAPKGNGRSCESLMAEIASFTPSMEFDSCHDERCFGTMTCSCGCGAVENSGDAVPDAPSCVDLEPAVISDLGICKDLWSGCEEKDDTCSQVKVESVFNAVDEKCYKVSSQQRGCTNGVCGGDHELVPYKVSTIVNLVGANATRWSHFYSQELTEIFSDGFHHISGGDISVLWVKEVDGDGGNGATTQILIEMSIRNENYKRSQKKARDIAACSSIIATGEERADHALEELNRGDFAEKLNEGILNKFVAEADVGHDTSENPLFNFQSASIQIGWKQQMLFCQHSSDPGSDNSNIVDEDTSKGGEAGSTLPLISIMTFLFVGGLVWCIMKRKARNTTIDYHSVSTGSNGGSRTINSRYLDDDDDDDEDYISALELQTVSKSPRTANL